MPPTSATPPRPRHARRAYSLLEVLITVLIIQIISSMVLVNVSSVQSTERLTRAAEQIVIAMRYARMVAMTSGQSAGVEFDKSGNSFRVFQGSSAVTASNALMSGGTYAVDFDTEPNLSGVTIYDVSIAGSSTNPYRVTFGNLGGTTNSGYITLSYGSNQKKIKVPLVGDASVVLQ
jgi:Tfp pilus assembly protein FimT